MAGDNSFEIDTLPLPLVSNKADKQDGKYLNCIIHQLVSSGLLQPSVDVKTPTATSLSICIEINVPNDFLVFGQRQKLINKRTNVKFDPARMCIIDTIVAAVLDMMVSCLCECHPQY